MGAIKRTSREWVTVPSICFGQLKADIVFRIWYIQSNSDNTILNLVYLPLF